MQTAVKKWSTSGEKNEDDKLDFTEIATVVEEFFKSLPASGTRRRTGR